MHFTTIASELVEDINEKLEKAYASLVHWSGGSEYLSKYEGAMYLMAPRYIRSALRDISTQRFETTVTGPIILAA
jgi:hypothetical protein